MMRKYKVVGFAQQDKPELRRGKLAIMDGYVKEYLRISSCGIDYHPALPFMRGNFYYPFTTTQDRLEEGLIRVDVPNCVGQGSITHYLSIDRLREIVGPSFMNIKVVILAPRGLGLLVNRMYSVIMNYKF